METLTNREMFDIEGGDWEGNIAGWAFGALMFLACL